jgi:hypothetical protein
MYGEPDKLAALVGQSFLFYGVDTGSFKLGNTVYTAVEDEDDGYRSYLGSIEEASPEGKIFFNQPLATVTVVARTGCDEGYYLLGQDGHVWLTVGTNSTDDYYPCFVFEYQPKESVNV